MSNSRLVHYTKISPNRTTSRNHPIDTVTIHCTAGLSTLVGLGDHFSRRTTAASCNYAVDTNGIIGMYVEEKDRSWCSSSTENDNRSITIEVVTESKPPYRCSEAAAKALVGLLVDICQRNNIQELRFQNNPELIGKPHLQNVTLHRWFANTDCPGDYILSILPNVIHEVNIRLKSPDSLYHVQIGAFKEKENAEYCLKKAQAAGFTDAFVV